MRKKEVSRVNLILSIQEKIRDMIGMPEDEELSEDIRFYEDLGFDSLDYPNLVTHIEIEYGLSFGILDDCQDKPNTPCELADAILIRVQVQVVIS